MKQITCLIIIIYIIVYLTISIYNKPNFEFFDSNPPPSTNVENGQFLSEQRQLSNEALRVLDKEFQKFKNQESNQNIQNRQIKLLKNRVDRLRNDIIVMKNKDKEETNSIYKSYSMDDSIAQLPNSIKERIGLGIPNEIDFNFTIDPTL